MREKKLSIQVHALHPGIVNTDLFKYSSIKYIPWFMDIFYKVRSFQIKKLNLHQPFPYRNLKLAHEPLCTQQSRPIWKAKAELTSATATLTDQMKKQKTQ